MVPRLMAAELAGTEYVIVPVFMPEEPDTIAIQEASGAAVQLHAEVVVMVAVNVPPTLGTDCAVGDTAYEHDEFGAAGDELCPHPVMNTSSNVPTPHRIHIANLPG
jgi:hypothetical protein